MVTIGVFWISGDSVIVDSLPKYFNKKKEEENNLYFWIVSHV